MVAIVEEMENPKNDFETKNKPKEPEAKASKVDSDIYVQRVKKYADREELFENNLQKYTDCFAANAVQPCRVISGTQKNTRPSPGRMM